MNTTPKNQNTFRAPSHPEQLSSNQHPHRDAYELITERIVALLSQGTVPWRKPWNAHTRFPRNLLSKKPYRGVNVFLLMALNYESPFWLTFRQAMDLGGRVRKGEKACPVVFWKPVSVEDQETGETKEIPFLRVYHVFNSSQCEGLEGILPITDPAAATAAKPAEIIERMPHRPVIKHGMTKAFYVPDEDYVGMPDRVRFDHETCYYSTLFHELAHSTGHASRLDRATLAAKAGFGSDPYCKEELIAEMGAAFLCGQADIAETTLESSAAYIQGWLAQVNHDKTLIVQAASQAQKAADYILGNFTAEMPVSTGA